MRNLVHSFTCRFEDSPRMRYAVRPSLRCAQRGLVFEKIQQRNKITNPLYARVERVTGRSHGRVSLRQCIAANA